MIMRNIKGGYGLIEIVVGGAIALVGVFSLFQTYNYYLKFALSHKYDVQMALLAEEGIEAIKLLRDLGWDANIASLAPGTPYGLVFVDSFWMSTTTAEYIDGKFERSFVLSEVYRDSDDRIADSGTLDSDTKKVTVSVSVAGILGTTTKAISTYVTNMFDN